MVPVTRHRDAVLVESPALQQYVTANRDQLRSYLRELEILIDTNPADTVTPRGRVRALDSFVLNESADCPIQPIRRWFQARMPDYTFTPAEVWWGRRYPVAPHNDVIFYLMTGRAVGLQMWFLLDVKSDGPGNNALEVFVPAVDGILLPGQSQAMTTRGLEPCNYDGVVGGNAMVPGNLLLFRNGAVHQCMTNKDVHRAALVMRLWLTDDPGKKDDNIRRWFSHCLNHDEVVKKKAKGNPYIPTKLADYAQDFDASRLTKEDRNLPLPSLADMLSESSVEVA